MTIQFELSKETQRHAEARAAELGYASVEEYLASLLAADLELPISEELEGELLSALKTPSREFTPADWDRKRHELIERHRNKAG